MGHFCINCGAPLEVRVIEGREHEVCHRDGFVLWHDPKVSVSVVVMSAGSVVLGRRAIEPGYGLWCLPGGFVNDDESPVEAAVRECREEIGVTVEIDGLLDVYHSAKTTAPSLVIISYRGTVAAGETPAPGDETLEVGLFRLDELPQIAFPSHRQALALYAAAAAHSGSPPSPAPAAPRPQRTR